MMFEGGQYGNDYLSRASINLRAAGLNVPERALYPNRYTDSQGKQLNGDNQYRMIMPADAPAEAFWSLTMYDAENLFMVENEIDRYSISTNRAEELKFAQDGTLPICIQHTKPSDESCNWLPAPKDDFYLHIRLYEPTAAVLNNEYEMPQVHKL
ncbi:phosphatidylserine decarboxylase [Vibrio astriarenae]|nr:phosphatidylserine decarboxylase [Vibrio sp. C7]